MAKLPNNQRPKVLRDKKTRAIRRALTKKEVRVFVCVCVCGLWFKGAQRLAQSALWLELRPVRSPQCFSALPLCSLPPHPFFLQLGAQTIKQKKKIANFSKKTYAVKA